MRTSACLASFTAIISTLALAPDLSAHCDSLDGPVIVDARAALAAGKPDLVLKWIRAEDDAQIRAAFDQTLGVRTLSPAAEVLADRWFFETLVRIHRAGEGAPYTGLKDADSMDTGIAAADRTLATGDLAPLVEATTQGVVGGLQSRFVRVRALAAHKSRSIADGRAYVEAYVDFIHFAEAAMASQAHATELAPAHNH